MAKIITVTANTALDLFIELEGLGTCETIQADSSVEFACGKGVNVARGLASLSQSVLCLGFVGQQSLASFQSLNNGFIQADFIAVDGKTRTNITLRDTVTQCETHIRTAGFKVSERDCQTLYRQLQTVAEPGDIVILSGSLPPAASVELYRQLIDGCRQKQAMVILDGSGEAMRQALSAKPWLIKPNHHELETLVGSSLQSEQEIIVAARSVIAQGIEWVVVSRGEQGITAVSQDEVWSSNVTRVPGKVRTHVGCGDTLVAGLAFAKLHDENTEQMLAQGTCCAVANLLSKEPGGFNVIDVDRVRPLLQIRRIQEEPLKHMSKLN